LLEGALGAQPGVELAVGLAVDIGVDIEAEAPERHTLLPAARPYWPAGR